VSDEFPDSVFEYSVDPMMAIIHELLPKNETKVWEQEFQESAVVKEIVWARFFGDGVLRSLLLCYEDFEYYPGNYPWVPGIELDFIGRLAGISKQGPIESERVMHVLLRILEASRDLFENNKEQEISDFGKFYPGSDWSPSDLRVTIASALGEIGSITSLRNLADLVVMDRLSELNAPPDNLGLGDHMDVACAAINAIWDILEKNEFWNEAKVAFELTGLIENDPMYRISESQISPIRKLSLLR
jgi:hypothetical protein